MADYPTPFKPITEIKMFEGAILADVQDECNTFINALESSPDHVYFFQVQAYSLNSLHCLLLTYSYNVEIALP
jgi:hypothetical protein